MAQERALTLPQQTGCSRSRGPTTIDLTGTGYSADTYNKASYITEEKELAHKTKILIARAQLWTPSVADKIVEQGLKQSDSDYTSWIGFRKSDSPVGEYEGAAWQEEVVIPTTKGSRRFLWMKLRVFAPEAQGLHFGRTSMQLSLSAHPEVDSIGHRSGSARAVRAWLESDVFQTGRRFPRDITFEQDPAVAQMLLWIWETYRTDGEMPSMITGVSKYDYPEPNGADPVDEKYTGTMETRKWMKEVLKMKFKKGDALYEIGELK
ncbi:hypothetical protein KKE03_00595 [Patescibacteria group bacterium]|nr:hypothetical protein [Patescibacteria group bacterium]